MNTHEQNEHTARFAVTDMLKCVTMRAEHGVTLLITGSGRLATYEAHDALMPPRDDRGEWGIVLARLLECERAAGPSGTSGVRIGEDLLAIRERVCRTGQVAADVESAPTPAASLFLRMEDVLKCLHDAALSAGCRNSDPVMTDASSVLRQLQQARAAQPDEAGVDGHSPGIWSGQFYQADHGASLALTAGDAGVIALVPHANIDGHDTDEDSIDAETAPREAFDIPNLRRIAACVNACDGMSTAMLEAMRPDVKPFVDGCGQNFVICSKFEMDAGDGAGFWSDDVGWTVLEGATRFTQADTARVDLPVLHLKPGTVDDTAFMDLATARLLAEAAAPSEAPGP